MKKSVCLMAILGAFAASGAMAAAPAAPNADNQEVNVKFTGKIVTSQCVITAGNGGTVDLGTFNTTNQSAPVVPVKFSFSKCTNAAEKMAQVTLKEDGGSYPGQGNVGQHTLSTDKQGINIQLYKDMDGNTPGMAQLNDQNGKLNQSGAAAAITVAYAKMVGTKAGALKAGDVVKGVGVFEVTFN